MRLHPREAIVGQARTDLGEAVLDWRKTHALTTAETVAVLTEVFGDHLGGIAKYAIREERHGNQDKPGDVE